MAIVVLVLLLVAAHFSLTVFAPGAAGGATFYWPWAANSQPILAGIGGLPQTGGGVVTPALAGIAGLCVLAATASLLGIVVPVNWWVPLVVAGALASIVLFVVYLGPLSIIPIALDLILLWGVALQHWTVAALRGV